MFIKIWFEIFAGLKRKAYQLGIFFKKIHSCWTSSPGHKDQSERTSLEVMICSIQQIISILRSNMDTCIVTWNKGTVAPGIFSKYLNQLEIVGP